MKSTALFVATSLILVVAMVPIAISNPVQAVQAGKRQWCWTDAEFSKICSDTKADCKASIPRNAVVQKPCHVEIVNVQWCWTDKDANNRCFDSVRECKADQAALGFLEGCHKVSL